MTNTLISYLLEDVFVSVIHNQELLSSSFFLIFFLFAFSQKNLTTKFDNVYSVDSYSLVIMFAKFKVIVMSELEREGCVCLN